MEKKGLILLVISVSIMLILAFILFYQTNIGLGEYKKILFEQQKDDSSSRAEAKKYSEIITKFVQDTVFNFGGKKLSASQLINELYKAQDSVSKTMNACWDLEQELRGLRHDYFSCLRSQGWVQNDLDQAILARDIYKDSTSYYKNLIKEHEKDK